MPRFARPLPPGTCAHVVTRGNARSTVFHSASDYQAFVALMCSAGGRIPLDVFAWCIMPNHVHLVVRPAKDGDLARWMHWLLTTHVQRHRTRHGTTGRVWQGRYRAFPIQADRHLLTVLRYVERNPVRAGLCSCSEHWPWSSASDRVGRARADRPILADSPAPLPRPWLSWVDTPLTNDELERVRTSVARGRPLGDDGWTLETARRLDLIGTLRPRGRPRKQ